MALLAFNHTAFDEAWILKLNQSHMSPTVRRQGGQRDCRRETEGVAGMERANRGRGRRKGKERDRGEALDFMEEDEWRRLD